ncbi:hypothetical protein [Streptosporangium sp. NPDC000396]|uniref:hypothetical protein n=1 Tax=Streptosporangium sp. NPDC000396 TaxID=3366185 RepID=UPI003673F041
MRTTNHTMAEAAHLNHPGFGKVKILLAAYGALSAAVLTLGVSGVFSRTCHQPQTSVFGKVSGRVRT